MSKLGVYLTLWVGENCPKPAKSQLMESLQRVEVTLNDDQRSGFEIAFQDVSDRLKDDLKPFNRIILMVTIKAVKHVLMDGIIAYQQSSSENGSDSSTFSVTGEDVSMMMDLKEEDISHKSQDGATVARSIISKYFRYGMKPDVTDPNGTGAPGPNDWVPRQNGTDLQHLKKIANKYGYVFYISPGPVPLVNTAYWGPPNWKGTSQKALSVNMGPFSNVETINFSYDSLSPTTVKGHIQDSKTNKTQSVKINSSTLKSISQKSALSSQSKVRSRLPCNLSGHELSEALALAQGMTDRSIKEAARAQGTLETIRYGGLLIPRKLVDLRGAGKDRNGTWYVKTVTHSIHRGDYKQSFTLTRGGTGSKSARVNP
jgi:phage protein D